MSSKLKSRNLSYLTTEATTTVDWRDQWSRSHALKHGTGLRFCYKTKLVNNIRHYHGEKASRRI